MSGQDRTIETATSVQELPLDQRRTRITVALAAVLSLICIVIMSAVWERSDPKLLENAPALLQIDINQATAREFSLLPNVGPVLGRRIVSDRDQNGPFQSVADLDRVQGIGEKTVALISEYCVVQPLPENKVAFAADLSD